MTIPEAQKLYNSYTKRSPGVFSFVFIFKKKEQFLDILIMRQNPSASTILLKICPPHTY
jgi:hypothetical protein